MRWESFKSGMENSWFLGGFLGPVVMLDTTTTTCTRGEVGHHHHPTDTTTTTSWGIPLGMP